MPSLNTLLAISLTTISALAAPARNFTPTNKQFTNTTTTSSSSSPSSSSNHKTGQVPTCLTPETAQHLATSYGLLISNYTSLLADTLLHPNFTDYSQSVNTLINSCPQGSEAHTLPLSAPTFTSREAFKAGQSQQPPINFLPLAIWHSCTSVSVRWKTTNTVNETDLTPPAKRKDMGGEGRREEKKTNEWKIHTVYSEFDSGAWLQNLKDADICGNPEKNLGAPDANPNSDSDSDSDSDSATASRPVKRARMLV
ncbi:hypothetical protein CERZMDRAFT_102738 [Cercospora zeae-maydis SCOH1-5]|uniref:NTF2-like domain-containing protein n=1 Tax=Cercospora zeae-maydis SCOH1-5 TaxID=717836 RepID=A0A6A6F1B0_9PEZI|nr:hypothetical protein CERZMDRAFT_102738 [Cercospora zeae-maydis SCOH1-5]